MQLTWITITLVFTITYANDIELLECKPPDQPRWGGYSPRQYFYVPGDTIHYYCHTETKISGNFVRKCEDTGDWTGDTPVCDFPSGFSSTTMTNTADDTEESSWKAVDGLRNTCTSTKGGQTDEWCGNFTFSGQLTGVMLFLPKGPVSFVVVLVKSSGEEIICGILAMNVDRYDWHYQSCPGPENRDASGIKIKSLNKSPLQICEISAYVLPSPTCKDPHYRIGNGYLRLNRKSAILICDQGYIKSPNTELHCVRDGVWNRKALYCLNRSQKLDERYYEYTERRRSSGILPKQSNPEEEMLEAPNRSNPEQESLVAPNRTNPE